MEGLVNLVKAAGSVLVGAGVVIEKGFQSGGKRLREQNIRLESLAVIDRMDENGIRFKD
jgi:xanthine phosphoribosyltransferase